MTTETRLAALERKVSELEAMVKALRTRIEHMLSRSGGEVVGQVHVDGHLQFKEQTSVLGTRTDCIRVYAADVGGVSQLLAKFPDGTIKTIVTE